MKNDASALWLRISAHGTQGLKQDWQPYIDGIGKAQKGLFVPRGPAKAIPCGSDMCMEGCYAEVQEVAGKFRAVCPMGYRKPFDVSLDHILLYEVHIKTLHRQLAKALSLNDEFSEFPENGRLLRIGKSTQAIEIPRPYYVAYCFESRHLKACLSDIQADASGKPFVLLLANPKAHSPGFDGQVATLGGELKILRDLVDVTATGIIARDTGSVKESAVEYRPSAKFPTPANCSWKDIRIEFLNDDEVKISAPGIKGERYSYSAMGMQNQKKTGTKQHNLQWTTLKAFAIGGGRIPYRVPQKAEALKKQKQLLCDALIDFFGIAEPPIVGRKGEYICLFTIVPNRKTERKTSISRLEIETDSGFRDFDDDDEYD